MARTAKLSEEQKRINERAAEKRHRDNPDNKPAIRAALDAWRIENKDKLAKIARRHRLKRDYGITIEQYNAMYTAQDGRCAICHKTSDSRALAVDHNHDTKKVRGLLCLNCNLGLGYLKDDPGIVETALQYLMSHP